MSLVFMSYEGPDPYPNLAPMVLRPSIPERVKLCPYLTQESLSVAVRLNTGASAREISRSATK